MGDLVPRTRDKIAGLAGEGLPWVDLSVAVAEVLRPVIGFEAFCFHTVDPGTILFTGSVNREVGCSGSWLAHHEYVVEDVTKWSFLAGSGRLAGATSIETHGDLGRSARHRSQENMGFGDELRVSFVADGIYWGAAGLLRSTDDPWFTEADVRALAALSPLVADGLRRAIARTSAPRQAIPDHGPGVVVFDRDGRAESISPAAERWVGEIVEEPPPTHPTESKVLQSVAARARSIAPGTDPLELAARVRVRTRTGQWLLLYGTRLTGGEDGRTAVIIHPATPQDIGPVVALSYGLTARESDVVLQCIQGRTTKEMARALTMSPYTVQDHLKSIFEKTGVRSRGELVGQVFLDHYVPRWEQPASSPPGLLVREIKDAGGG